VLVSVAGRLKAMVRIEDVPARLGGDEFVVLFAAVEDEDDVATVAARMVYELGRPHRTSVGKVSCGASIGVAFAQDGEGSLELLARADQALYEAKDAGRGRVAFALRESL